MFETLLAIGGALISAGVVRGATRSLYRHFKPKVKGTVGEGKVHRILRRFARKTKDGFCFRDLLIPKQPGTAQIDNILINRFGIFLIEVKNYAGTVLGNEFERWWTHKLRNGEEKSMYNPIMQNKEHVAALSALLKDHPNLRFYSIVAFSNQCKLAGVMPNVVHFGDLFKALLLRCKGEPILTEAEVRQIASKIESLNIPGRKARKEHAARAALSAEAAKNMSKSDLEQIYADARNAPILDLGTNQSAAKEVPKERSMMSDEGAMVRIRGKTDSIEHFFERSKRDSQGLPVPEKAAFTHFICPYTGKSFPVSEARPFYRGLWATYLKQNPELVSYLNELGPDRIRCASARTETVLRSYVQDSTAFQSEIRQSAWYQNVAQQQRNKKDTTQRQALDKAVAEHPPQMKKFHERKASLDNQIKTADKSKQPPQNHKPHTHDDLTH